MALTLLPQSPIRSLEEYLATETGGLGVHRAQELGAEAAIEEVRRRGFAEGVEAVPDRAEIGAGIASQAGRHYVVCNGAEGEPGSFKDRALMRSNPYQLVEGLIIAAFAVDAQKVYMCLKQSFEREPEAVTRAVQEFQTAGICADCSVLNPVGSHQHRPTAPPASPRTRHW